MPAVGEQVRATAGHESTVRRLARWNQATFLLLTGLMVWSGGLAQSPEVALQFTRRILAHVEFAHRQSTGPSFARLSDTEAAPSLHAARFDDDDDDLDLPMTDLGAFGPVSWGHEMPGRAGPFGSSASSPTGPGHPPRPGRLRC